MRFFREASLSIRVRNKSGNGYQPTPIIVNGLRISFNIIKSLSSSTNSAIIRVWNLNQDTRNLLNDYGYEVTVYAGYERSASDRTPQLLYIGDTNAVSHLYEPPEIISTFECGDGDKYVNNFFNDYAVSLSFGAGTQARTIILEIAHQMGIDLVRFSISDNLVYQQKFNFIGFGRDALFKVCSYLGLQSSVQNNSLQIIPLQGSINETPIYVNSQTGMQGVPQRFTYRNLYLYSANDAPKTGYKINTMLNPLILPGSPIILDSTHLGVVKGSFYVENVRHDGDTYGPVWSSQLQVQELLK